MVREISKSFFGAAGKAKSLLLLALRKIRRSGRSVEDPRRTLLEDMIRGTHAKGNQQFSWWSSEELVPHPTHPVRRTIRGGFAEVTAEDMNAKCVLSGLEPISSDNLFRIQVIMRRPFTTSHESGVHDHSWADCS